MLEKSFNPQDSETRLYKAWEESGAFKPKMDTALEAYSIVIPPPNVTGSLHMGHALNNTLQDILIRFERMRGKDVLWQPGTDHAGIATQMVVERKLAAEGKPGRKDMTREEFEAIVWDWKAESGGTIVQQLRRLGASCDWSRERFTMGDPNNPDDKMAEAVVKVFVQMHEEGLIYRDKRLVNWDPHFQTAISDLEVENKEIDGHFWHFKYPLALKENGERETYTYVEKDEDGNVTLTEERNYISIATTRPETMLGDGAVAVHPDDERYASIVGKMVRLPLADRLIPIITDEYPDPKLGSGAVKITGAHDFNDYDVAKRNDLPLYSLMDEVACMMQSQDKDGQNMMPEKYVGMDRFEARKAVVADIDAEGLLIAVEDKKIMQPLGDRSGVVIEPMLTDQWFVDAETLSKPAVEAVNSGKTNFVPENWKKTYDNWMLNIQPWCISRQLWWGHRIPAWYGPTLCKNGHVIDISGQIFVAVSEDEALKLAREKYAEFGIISNNVETADTDFGIPDVVIASSYGGDTAPVDRVQIKRDPDVLDTWFSSGLWPFSTMGWPEETDELAKFYPGSVLVTAFDIIFFWVARMMMQGIHFMDNVPFKDVYIHALVLDEKGQKMSKSKGNVVDPLAIIDEYGADALRFNMAAQAAQGRNVRLSMSRIEGYRNFGTKLWNAARFAEMNGCKSVPDFDPATCTQSVNQWVVGEAVSAVKEVTRCIESYRFNDAADAAYKFSRGFYCDWYLELIKPIMADEGSAKVETQATAGWVLDQILKVLQPFMPFITEELWAHTADTRETHLILADWPVLSDELINASASDDINWLIRLVTALRSVRAEMNVPPSKKAPLMLIGADSATLARMETYTDALGKMARVETWSVAESAPKGALQTVVDGVICALPLDGLVDLDAERARLSKEMEKTQGEIDKIEKKLGNTNFVDRAPEHVVAEQHSRKETFMTELEKMKTALANLS